RHFWLSAARAYGRVSAPRNTCLNWTIPALVKSRLGSLAGTSGALGTIVCPRSRKKSRNPCRIWSPVTGEGLSAASRGGNPDAWPGPVSRRRSLSRLLVSRCEAKPFPRSGIVQPCIEGCEEVVARFGPRRQCGCELDRIVPAKPMLLSKVSRPERETLMHVDRSVALPIGIEFVRCALQVDGRQCADPSPPGQGGPSLRIGDAGGDDPPRIVEPPPYSR